MTLSGGFAGSLFMIPLGIAMSRQSLRSVEDPQHMARALQGYMQHRREAGGSFPPLSDQSTSDQPTSELSGDAVDLAAGPVDFSSWDSRAAPASGEQGGQSEQTLSRWEQLRRDRSGTPQVWDQIRQRNAKEALGSGRNPSITEAPAQETSWSSIPTRPSRTLEDASGSSESQYERAKREYEAAFQRESQGLDIASDFSEKKTW